MNPIFSQTHLAHDFLKSGSVVAIGNFDGVHVGHQKILKDAHAYAQKHHLHFCVLSFDPHPTFILSPSVQPLLIQSKAQKTKALFECGATAVILQEFDKNFAALTPEVFFTKHIVKDLNAKAVFVGYDFTFGLKRSGTTDTLSSLGQAHSVFIHVTPAQFVGTSLVSSSLIRKLLSTGHVKEAAQYLTRPYTLEGLVCKGLGRGKTLGFPTANLKTPTPLVLDDGVYATLIKIDDTVYKSVTHVGQSATFNESTRSIETHVLDFNENLYDKTVEVYFCEFLRPIQKFDSPQTLIHQIEADISKARALL